MDDEKLIEYVRNYKELYFANLAHSQYLNRNYKNKKWTKSKKIGTTKYVK